MSETDFESARLTVRLGAIVANYRTVEKLAGPAAVGAVVKANAYGTGDAFAAAALAAAGCDTFFVARVEEGIALRPRLPEARIFVLDGAPPDAVPALVTHRLTPVLNSLGEVASWSAVAHASRATLDAAIHIDTGMNRLGVPGDELALLAAEHKKRFAGIRLVLVMSHLACADDAESKMNRTQLDRFRTALSLLPAAPASLAASAGVLLGKDYAFDMVRPGIGLFGGNPRQTSSAQNPSNPFRTVAVLAARLLQLRRVDKGESVGYGATFRAKGPTVIATAALGYADGLMRAIGNRGSGAIHGQRAPIAGRVSMDLITLDVTDLRDVKVGDDVEFLGDTITLDDLATASNTAPYEILTSLSRRAPRHYVEAER